MVYLIAAGAADRVPAVVWQLYRSRYGELLVATRDAEERVRFLGYDPANIKLVAFVVAALMASIGGAMFVPIAGIITPADVDAAASIMLIAGVALGGRASLLRPRARRDGGRLGAVDASARPGPTAGPTSSACCSSSSSLFLPSGLVVAVAEAEVSRQRAGSRWRHSRADGDRCPGSSRR